MFNLVADCGIGYEAAWDMPVVLRHWWFQQVDKRNEKNGGAPPPKEQLKDPFGRAVPNRGGQR